VQVDPLKPELTSPRTERLKLKCDALLTTFAFEFNLRRYIMTDTYKNTNILEACSVEKRLETLTELSESLEVGRCRLTLSNPR
jgi:hypothetical protein